MWQEIQQTDQNAEFRKLKFNEVKDESVEKIAHKIVWMIINMWEKQ